MMIGAAAADAAALRVCADPNNLPFGLIAELRPPPVTSTA
jgi:hypothetical protein